MQQYLICVCGWVVCFGNIYIFIKRCSFKFKYRDTHNITRSKSYLATPRAVIAKVKYYDRLEQHGTLLCWLIVVHIYPCFTLTDCRQFSNNSTQPLPAGEGPDPLTQCHKGALRSTADSCNLPWAVHSSFHTLWACTAWLGRMQTMEPWRRDPLYLSCLTRGRF